MKLNNLIELNKLTESPDSSRARVILDKVRDKIDSLDTTLNGKDIKILLSYNGFPETESKAMLDAFNKFQNMFDDFEMGIMTRLDTE